ncbi:DUF1826 domain-containing protein [Thalassotalea euphylliae]|uniref:DUF1826 domain-containing protein n=1 Tax=Thalassotalea euphylliae TaxID=1655234 RepID=UPI00363B83EA
MSIDILADKHDVDAMLHRTSSSSEQPTVLTDIYKEDINLAIWEMNLAEDVKRSAVELLSQKPAFKSVLSVTPDDVYEQVLESTEAADSSHALGQHVTTLVDMFCTLFDLKRAGLRFIALDKPMCPKFHVDNVPCRLVSTLHGPSTEWLQHNSVVRTKLGAGSKGLSDDHSGIMLPGSIVQQLNTGDVALLKGEGWYKNERAGLVHRSPTLLAGEQRLLITLDFIN